MRQVNGLPERHWAECSLARASHRAQYSAPIFFPLAQNTALSVPVSPQVLFHAHYLQSMALRKITSTEPVAPGVKCLLCINEGMCLCFTAVDEESKRRERQRNICLWFKMGGGLLLTLKSLRQLLLFPQLEWFILLWFQIWESLLFEIHLQETIIECVSSADKNTEGY